MRTLVFFIFLTIIFSCSTSNEKTDEIKELIVFDAKPVKTQSLYAKPILKADLKNQQLLLNLELKKLTARKIFLNEIVLSNPGGLNSNPNNVQFKKLAVTNNNDTTLYLTFNHIPNKKLFHATGLPGTIDSVYRVSVLFSLEGTEGVRTMNLDFTLPFDTFLSAKKKYDDPVQIYNFNTDSGFAERQREHLLNKKIIKSSPFVNISDQEIAVSGLNFRVKCFHQKDMLNAEIFVVNHSDLTIRIDTTKINLIVDSLAKVTAKQEITIQKVTGSIHEKDILRKGDRIIVTLHEFIRDKPKHVKFTVENSFFLADGKRLFTEDLVLMRVDDFLQHH